MKIKTHIGNNEELDIAIQRLLFDMGYKWASGGSNYHDTGIRSLKNSYRLCIEDEYLKYVSNLLNQPVGETDSYGYELLDMPSFIQRAREAKAEKEVTIRLNGEYSAVIKKHSITVGENIFSHANVEDVAKAIAAMPSTHEITGDGVRIHIGNNPEIDKVIQTHCIEAGFGWSASEPYNPSGIKTYKDGYHLYFAREGWYLMYGDRVTTGNYPVISVADFLNVVRSYKKVEVMLNTKYTAVIHKGIVVVGCQKFTYESIQKLNDELQKFKAKNK